MTQRPFNIHPHIGYLNTEVSITNTSDSDIVIYDNGERLCSLRPNCMACGRFCAGSHVISLQKDYSSCEYSDSFTIEDAVKLGGGKVVKGYISDKTPWIVVKMTDRMYFHNRNNNTEFVEINLVPDEVSALAEDLLLFRTKNEGYSVYSVSASNVIASFTEDPLYVGRFSLVYQSLEGELSILYYTDTLVRAHTYEKYAINEEQGEIYIYEDNSLWVMSLLADNDRSLIFLDEPVITLTGDGRYALLSKSYEGTTVKFYSVHKSTLDEVNDSIKLESNVTSVCSYKLVEDSFLENIDKEFDKLWSQRESQFRHFISVDSVYSEILNLYILDSAVYYKEKKISRNQYGRKKENYYLCSSLLSEPIEIYAYTRIYCHGRSVIFQLDSNVVTITDGIILNNAGSLIQHNDKSYIVSSTAERRAILTVDGEIVYEGSFETSAIAFSLNEKRNTLAKLFESYGWVLDTDESGKKLRTVIHHWNKMHFDSINFDSLFILDGKLIVEYENKLFCLTSDSNNYILPSVPSEKSSILSIADSGNYILKYRDNQILYEGCERDEFSALGLHELDSYEVRILEDIFDVSAYSEALFTKDGDSIVYADANGRYFQRNLTTGEIAEFDSCKYIKHINGYSPSIEIGDNRIPRIINPVTGRYVETNLFEFKFTSPDGTWMVVDPEELAQDNVGGLECIHKGTKQITPIKEYYQLRQRLDIPKYSSSISPEKQAERLKLMASLPELFVDELKRHCLESALWKKVAVDANRIKKYAINSSDVDELTCKAFDHFLKYTNNFTNFIFKVTEYIKLSNQHTGQSRRINIGIPLWFMNYVSFSYDSRYVAIAGRYEDDTMDENRNCLGGLYFLYDLVENKVVSKKTNSQAVWVTSFTKQGHIGYYDSHPTTYITNSNGDVCSIIGGRNFLTFSPSGKFFALSNQGYVRIDNASADRPGGHQPSTNVYIRGTYSPNEELASFNDHGDKIKGVMTRKAKTVAMVAFSPDDKRLLSISDDGVIVIRNLNLSESGNIQDVSINTTPENLPLDDLPF